jgi:hypothetical protein
LEHANNADEAARLLLVFVQAYETGTTPDKMYEAGGASNTISL